MIDWKSLAESVGALKDGHEMCSSVQALEAIELLIGAENIKEAVDLYVARSPGSELIRTVIWQLHSPTAMQRCYEIYKTSPHIDDKRLAIDLLRVAADRRVLPWIDELLHDSDAGFRGCGISIVDQLLFSGLVDSEEVEHLLQQAESHSDAHLREYAKSIRDSNSRACAADAIATSDLKNSP